MYVTRGMEVGHPKCLQIRTVGEGYHVSCVRTHLHYLFSCFFMFFLCFYSASIFTDIVLYWLLLLLLLLNVIAVAVSVVTRNL